MPRRTQKKQTQKKRSTNNQAQRKLATKKQGSGDYKERIKAFQGLLSDCINVSRKCSNILSPTGAHFYASVLFTVLCTRAVSLAILAPETAWSRKAIEHWDYASLAVLVRSLLEVRLAFFYLCVEECDPIEWECRLNLFHLHDCTARIQLFQEMNPDSNDIEGFKEQAKELKARLETNKFFCALSAPDRRRFLHGKNAYLVPLEEIAVAAGVDLHNFRWIYKFLSSHVHGLPLSFYRIGRDYDDRGRGLHSRTEDNYACLCISLSLTLLIRSRDEMKALFEPYVAF